MARPSKTPDPEILWNVKQTTGRSWDDIAKDYSTSGQAVAQKVKRWLAKQGMPVSAQPETVLPWKVDVLHWRDSARLHRTVVSYAQWREGKELEAEWLAAAKRFEAIANEHNATLIYTTKDGYHWRSRLPSDTDIIMPE